MIRNISIAAIAVAGLVHLGIAPGQLSHAPAHGIFFGLAGVAQVAWAFAFWRVQSSTLTWSGIALSGGLIILWLSTRVMPTPFEPTTHMIDWSLMVTKASEFIAFIGLVGIGIRTAALGLRWTAAPAVATAALSIALLVGGGFWGIGHVGDVVFPYLGHDDAHQSEHIPGIEVAGAGMQVGGSMGLMDEHALASSAMEVDHKDGHHHEGEVDMDGLASLSSTVEVVSEVDHHPEGDVDLDDVDHHSTN